MREEVPRSQSARDELRAPLRWKVAEARDPSLGIVDFSYSAR